MKVAPQELEQAVSSLDTETVAAIYSLFNWFVCFSVHYSNNGYDLVYC